MLGIVRRFRCLRLLGRPLAFARLVMAISLGGVLFGAADVHDPPVEAFASRAPPRPVLSDQPVGMAPRGLGFALPVGRGR